MTIKQYQIECKRTCPSLGSREKDLLHMELGIITEVGEALDIFKKNLAYGKPIDYVNLGEELADICWYICNYQTFINKETNFKEYYLGYEISNEEEIFETFKEIVNCKEYDRNIYLFNIRCIAKFYNLNFEQLLDRNIKKLKIRFPDKFTKEQALNRDLDSERQVLENGYNVDIP